MRDDPDDLVAYRRYKCNQFERISNDTKRWGRLIEFERDIRRYENDEDSHYIPTLSLDLLIIPDETTSEKPMKSITKIIGGRIHTFRDVLSKYMVILDNTKPGETVCFNLRHDSPTPFIEQVEYSATP